MKAPGRGVVLDASALLAFLRREPGAGAVEARLPGSWISAVNLSEVLAKAIDHGATAEEASSRLRQLPVRGVPFLEEDAAVAASLRPATRGRGLSLGDRACLALATAESATALTCERIWTKFEAPCKVETLR